MAKGTVAGGVNKDKNPTAVVEAPIENGYHVRLRSGDEIKCHQHDKDKETQIHVVSAPTMPQTDTDEFKGIALMEGSRYALGDTVTFCKGCYKEIISAGRCNCGSVTTKRQEPWGTIPPSRDQF